MTEPARVVFLLDVDNTLLDNDQIVTDFKQHLVQSLGVDLRGAREELGYADYLAHSSVIGSSAHTRRTCWRSRCSWWTIRSPRVCFPALSTSFADSMFGGQR